MKKVLSVLVLLFIISRLASGQSINEKAASNQVFNLSIDGTVSSNQHQRLPYATVKLMKDTVTLATEVCDSLGHFLLSINIATNQGLSLKAFYLKGTSASYPLTSMLSEYDLVIAEAPTTLKEVIVTADKPTFIRKADRYIFTPGKALSEGSSALDIMRHTPLLTYDEKSEDFSIINKPGTIVYINNVKTTIPKDMLLATLRSLPASDIKSIEIITNPGSEYAANITGGIININIKKLPFEGWLGNLSVTSVQSKYNTSILNGALSYRKGSFALQFIPFINKSYNYNTKSDLLDFKNGKQENINTDYLRHYLVLGGGLNADYDINTKSFLSLKFWASGVSGNSSTNTGTIYNKAGSSAVDSTVRSPSTGKDIYSYVFGNLNYHYQLDKSGDSYIDVNTDFNHFYQDQKTTGSFIPSAISGQENSIISAYKNNLPQQFNNLSEKLEFSHSFNNNLRFSAGVQYSDTYVHNNLHYYNLENSVYVPDSSLSRNYSYTEKYWAGFVNFNKQISSKLNASLGLRFEQTNYSTQVTNEFPGNGTTILKDSIYRNLFPSLSISYSPDANNQLAFSINRKINRPSIELLFPGRTYQNANYYSENNPFLQPSFYYSSELDYTLLGKYVAQFSYTVEDKSYANFVIPTVTNNITQLKQTYLNYGTVKYLQLLLNTNEKLYGDIWEVNLSPYINYNLYNGNINPIDTKLKNFNFNFLFDNTVFLSKKYKWTAFVTFKYNDPVKNISDSQINPTSSLDLEFKKVIHKFSLYLIVTDIYNGSSVIKNNQYANVLLSENYSVTNTYNRSILLKVRYSFGNNKLKGNKDRGTANEDIKNRAGQ
jgi:iron complex outermembrane receptor protein